jgi:hypothetical protein
VRELVRVGSASYRLDEAFAVLVGYAFADEEVAFIPRGGLDYGSLPRGLRRRRFAYRTYDGLTHAKNLASASTLLAGAGLHGRIDLRTLESVLAVAPAVDLALRDVPRDFAFWELDPAEIATDAEPVDASARTFGLHRAWWLLMSLPEVGPALASKLLHHLRPAQVPLIDNSTATKLRRGRMWRAIHGDLVAQAPEFTRLEEDFAEEADSRDSVGLNRLRMHDVLLWADCVVGRRTDAARAGYALLGRGSADGRTVVAV